MQTFKRHPSLIPLVVIVGAGMALSGVYLLRLATRSPDVSWDKRGNPEPWQHYQQKQYKFLSSGRDYENHVDPRPKF